MKIAEKMNNKHKQIVYFYCNVRNLHTSWSKKESILLLKE